MMNEMFLEEEYEVIFYSIVTGNMVYRSDSI